MDDFNDKGGVKGEITETSRYRINEIYAVQIFGRNACVKPSTPTQLVLKQEHFA